LFHTNPSPLEKEVTVKCAICGKDSYALLLRLGAYCAEEHRLELLRRHQRLVEELRREEAAKMPEVLALADFERFVLKLAVRLVDSMSERVRKLYQGRAPALLDPLEMAEELKAHLLPHLPAGLVAIREAQGLSSLLFRAGTYRFLQPVPAALVIQALKKARFLPILGLPATGKGNSTNQGG